MLLLWDIFSVEENISLEFLYLHGLITQSSVGCYTLHFADWYASEIAEKCYGIVKMMTQWGSSLSPDGTCKTSNKPEMPP